MKKTASERKGQRGSGKFSSYLPNFNLQNDDRKARSDRAELTGIRKNTPNRSHTRAEISEDGQKVFYYHISKGFKCMPTVTANMGAFWDVLRRAQKHAAFLKRA